MAFFSSKTHSFRILFLICFNIFETEQRSPSLDRLQLRLFKTYHRFSRPTSSSFNQSATQLNFHVRLIRVIDINELKMTILAEFEIVMAYYDSELQWNPFYYDGIREFYTHRGELWSPRVVVTNEVDNMKVQRAPGRILSSGMVILLDYITTNVKCDIKVMNFPYDSQLCSFHFQLFNWETRQVVISYLSMYSLPNKIDRTYSEWKLRKVNAFYGLKRTYFPEDGEFSKVLVELCLSRKPANYVIYIVLPCGLVTFLVTFGFLLPADSGELVTCNLMVLLAYSVFQSLGFKIPVTSEIPVLIQLIYGSKMFVTVAIVISIFILRIFEFGPIATKSPPAIILKISRKYLRKILLLPDIVTLEEYDKNNDCELDFETEETRRERVIGQAKAFLEEETFDDKTSHNLLKDLLKKHRHEERRIIRAREWNFVSKIVSRATFLLLLFAFILGSFVFYYYAVRGKRPRISTNRTMCEYYE